MNEKDLIMLITLFNQTQTLSPYFYSIFFSNVYFNVLLLRQCA